MSDGPEPKKKPEIRICKKLPITKDGAHVSPGDTVFALHSKSGEILSGIVWWQPPQGASLRGSYQVRFRSANQINTVSLPMGVCFSSRRTLREAYRKQRKAKKKRERKQRKAREKENQSWARPC